MLIDKRKKKKTLRQKINLENNSDFGTKTFHFNTL